MDTMKDLNREKFEQLKERINELETEIVRKDDQMRELQHQLARAERRYEELASKVDKFFAVNAKR